MTESETRHLVDAGSHADPTIGLRAVAALRRLTEQLEEVQVASARAHGWSWSQIAGLLGVSKQAVHRKHARRSGHSHERTP